ncbi:MAG: fumarylacetoacetate hydrolase family protein [Ktedonobacteraceae bacterium]
MKLVTFLTGERKTRAGVLHGNSIIALEYPTLLELLRDPDGLLKAQVAIHPKPATPTYMPLSSGLPIALPELPTTIMYAQGPPAREEYTLNEVVLLPPIPDPLTVRDFYAFEQHVKTARAHRGLAMVPEWYEVPTFYFTNNSELYGHDNPIPYPTGSHALDFELEIACVIGRDGKDIPVEEATNYIAGYTIMNDWSARDFQMKDMAIGLGPGKGKDFATSLGPILVTPDELATRRTGQGASERYTMPMIARINGHEVSRGNFNQIHYSFAQMIAYASRNTRIRVGDVLGSGTVGTGCILELGTGVHRWLQRDDEVELEIEGIGVLRNRII